MSGLSKKLTLIIPTKNRLIWIERLLEYYNKNNFLGKILIADSSDDIIHNQIKIRLLDFKKLDVLLIHLPDCGCEMAVFEASKEIKTKYSTFVADDDLILVEGINQAIFFLDTNSNYVSAHGKAYLISTINNSAYGKINSLIYYNLSSYDDDDKFLRIRSYFKYPTSLCFSITRSEIFIESYTNIMKLDRIYQTYVIGENLQSVTYLGKGKCHKLDFDYLVRQAHNDNTYHKMNFKDWSEEKNFTDAKNVLLDHMKQLFDFEKNNEIEKMIDVYFNNFNKMNLKENTVQLKILSLFKNSYLKLIIKYLKYYFFDIYKIKIFNKKNNLQNYLNIVEKKY